MKGAELWVGQNGASCSIVQLATQSKVASSIVLPWLQTSPLTSAGPKGRAGEETTAGQCESWLLCLPAGGWTLAGLHRGQAASRPTAILTSGLFLISAHLHSLLFHSFDICPSSFRNHSLELCVLDTGLGAGNMEVKEAVSRSYWCPASNRVLGAQEGLRRLPGGGGI